MGAFFFLNDSPVVFWSPREGRWDPTSSPTNTKMKSFLTMRKLLSRIGSGITKRFQRIRIDLDLLILLSVSLSITTTLAYRLWTWTLTVCGTFALLIAFDSLPPRLWIKCSAFARNFSLRRLALRLWRTKRLYFTFLLRK